MCKTKPIGWSAAGNLRAPFGYTHDMLRGSEQLKRVQKLSKMHKNYQKPLKFAEKAVQKNPIIAFIRVDSRFRLKKQTQFPASGRKSETLNPK